LLRLRQRRWCLRRPLQRAGRRALVDLDLEAVLVVARHVELQSVGEAYAGLLGIQPVVPTLDPRRLMQEVLAVLVVDEPLSVWGLDGELLFRGVHRRRGRLGR